MLSFAGRRCGPLDKVNVRLICTKHRRKSASRHRHGAKWSKVFQVYQVFLAVTLVSSVASRQHLRSASRGLLVMPCHRLSSYGRRAFSVAGPAMWNWLSDSLRDPAISRDSFNRSLKTFLLSAYLYT